MCPLRSGVTPIARSQSGSKSTLYSCKQTLWSPIYICIDFLFLFKSTPSIHSLLWNTVKHHLYMYWFVASFKTTPLDHSFWNNIIHCEVYVCIPFLVSSLMKACYVCFFLSFFNIKGLLFVKDILAPVGLCLPMYLHTNRHLF